MSKRIIQALLVTGVPFHPKRRHKHIALFDADGNPVGHILDRVKALENAVGITPPADPADVGAGGGTPASPTTSYGQGPDGPAMVISDPGLSAVDAGFGTDGLIDRPTWDAAFPTTDATYLKSNDFGTIVMAAAAYQGTNPTGWIEITQAEFETEL